MTDYLALVANAADATISTFRVGDDVLTPLATTSLPGASSTFAVDGSRDLVYAAVKGAPPAIVVLRLDRTEGVLTEVSRLAVDAPLAYVDLAVDGTVLLGASYHAGSGHTWVVGDGVLGDEVSRIGYPQLHCAVSAPDGRAYFVSLGADLVAQYSVSDAGVLAPLDPPTVSLPPGSGARHLALTPDLAAGYVVTEFSGEVFRFSRDAATGTLTRHESVSIVDPGAGLSHSRLGADPAAERLVWGADVHVAGDVVLASERSASTLAVVRRSADGTLVGEPTFTPTEAQPRGFAVTPDGGRVLAVGERSTMLSLSRLEADGRLTLLDRVATGRGANWIRMLPA